MLLTTWGIDYGIVVALCIYLNRHLVYDNGKLCPFAAGLTLHLMLMASVAKDEVVSRLLFRPFLARKVSHACAELILIIKTINSRSDEDIASMHVEGFNICCAGYIYILHNPLFFGHV